MERTIRTHEKASLQWQVITLILRFNQCPNHLTNKESRSRSRHRTSFNPIAT